MKEGKTTHLKFGGWDPEAIAYGSDLTFLKTDSSSDWKLNMDIASFAGEDIEANEARYGIFELAFPYMYIPMSDFNRIADIVNTKLGQVKCLKNIGKCYFEDSCDKIPDIGYLNVRFKDVNGNQVDMELDRAT